MRLSLAILGSFLCAAVVQTASAAEVPLQGWQPEAADQIFVDVNFNVGYILHENNDFISFPVATGLQKTIYWAKKRYYAATPVESWVVASKDTQSDRVMFGRTGRFFRLSVDGVKTSYGIHGFAYFDEWLEKDDRYRSYGCIVVSEQILDIVDALYAKAGKTISVTTMHGSQGFYDVIAQRERARNRPPSWIAMGDEVSGTDQR